MVVMVVVMVVMVVVVAAAAGEEVVLVGGGGESQKRLHNCVIHSFIAFTCVQLRASPWSCNPKFPKLPVGDSASISASAIQPRASRR
jgi:hypothetical protein